MPVSPELICIVQIGCWLWQKGSDGMFFLFCAGDGEEPEWVEVTVEVLLSLLAQSSGLIRRVCNNVFGLICQHMTKNALQLILDVS